MFAPRFDPDAELVERNPPKSLKRKRKLSNDSTELVLEAPSSESDSDSASDSSSDSSSESSSDSDDDSDDENAEQVSNGPESDSSNVPMVIDEPEPTISQQMLQPDQTIAEKEELTAIDDNDDYTSKHSKIFNKFKNSTAMGVVEEAPEIVEEEKVESQALHPMPQPELPTDAILKSTLKYLKNLEWLAKPAYSAPGTRRLFADFALSDRILKNLTALGFNKALSVQVSALELLLEDFEKNKLSPDFRGDILVNSSTGSGKTLAYSIPIVQALEARIVPRVRAIVLVPTKPLINQAASTLRDISKGTNLNVVSFMNDSSLKDEAAKVKANVPDIIVSTPGRLVDHLLADNISLEALRFLVIDEADRLLHSSFQSWCQVVLQSIEKWSDKLGDLTKSWRLKPQKLIFSATLSTDAGKLSLLKLKDPRLIVVNSMNEPITEMFSLPSSLKEYRLSYTSAKSAEKPMHLAKFLLKTNRLESVLVFAKSNDATLRLTRILGDLFLKMVHGRKIEVAYINSTNNLASVRSRLLRDFDQRNINILVATDLIARGIDIMSIRCVVNYDLPVSSREYVHRVGRTARANNDGEAFSMCFGGGEANVFAALMEDIGRVGTIEEAETPDLDETDVKIYSEVMEKFQQDL